MTKKNLRVVTDPNPTQLRAYVLAIDPADFVADVARLEELDWVVINSDEDRLIDEVDLRVHLMGITTAYAIMLPGTWWTSVEAHQLVTVAGWLGIKFIDEQGHFIQTVSARA